MTDLTNDMKKTKTRRLVKRFAFFPFKMGSKFFWFRWYYSFERCYKYNGKDLYIKNKHWKREEVFKLNELKTKN